MYAACDGRFVPEEVAAVLDAIAWRSRTNPTPIVAPKTRARMHYAEQREQRVMAALLTVADRCGSEERASFFPGIHPIDQRDEASRIAAEHGFGPDRLIAMKGLARSRGVGLEVVLRAALRGDLRSIVVMPPRVKADSEASSP